MRVAKAKRQRRQRRLAARAEFQQHLRAVAERYGEQMPTSPFFLAYARHLYRVQRELHAAGIVW